jgi:hypothetical protein
MLANVHSLRHLKKKSTFIHITHTDTMTLSLIIGQFILLLEITTQH